MAAPFAVDSAGRALEPLDYQPFFFYFFLGKKEPKIIWVNFLFVS